MVLTNMLSAAVTSVDGNTIKLFSPDEALVVEPPVDEAALFKKRQAETLLQRR